MVIKIHRRVVCTLLCGLLFLGLILPQNVYAQNSIYVSQARNLALSNSSEINKQYNKIVLQRVKYIEAVKGIKEKVRNITTFRWSPLFGFHFPERLNMTQEYDLNVKPLVLQMDISVLTHQLDDLHYKVSNDVNQGFIETYVAQEKANFTTKLLENAKTDLSRNQARLLTGAATQNDVDTMEKTVKALTSELSAQKKNFENAKKKLTDLCKLDVTTGYTFANPLVTVNITRNLLAEFTDYTLQHDHEYFESKIAESIASINLNCYVSLMKKHYGNSMNRIMPYINMAKAGMDVDYNAFQLEYRNFLYDIDSRWFGSYRILFFRFPKEWTKGQLDGTRYIEDEIYAVYTACMEYAAASREKESAKKALESEIKTSYETIVSAYNAYNSLNEQLVSTKVELKKMTALNMLGKVEYSELKDKQDDYQQMQLEALDALAGYNQLLFEFDRLTCGAVQKYMRGESLSLDSQKGGDSFATYSDTEKPYYYIYQDIDNMLFVFGLNIPDEFEPEITDYEVWYTDIQIGPRTAIDTQLRHLALDYGGTSKLIVRLYDGNEFVEECEIDVTVPRDELQFKGVTPVQREVLKQIGKYHVETVSYGSFQTSILTLDIDPTLGAQYYSLSVPGGAKIFTEELIPITENFSYLTALVTSLGIVECTLYDNNANVLYIGSFDTKTQSVMTAITQ